MLLKEITSTDKVIKAKGKPQLPSKPIGEGLFAEVYPGKKTNTVIKVSKSKHPDDAYVAFVQEALQHQDNPFFPRINHAKLYHLDEESEPYTFVVEMEKLIPLTEDKIIDVVPHLLEQIGINTDELKNPDTGGAQVKSGYKEPETLSDQPKVGYAFSNMLVRVTDPGVREELRERAQNPKFLEALDAFDRLLLSYTGDFHAGNWMVRLTGTGPQLVVTDPIAFKK